MTFFANLFLSTFLGVLVFSKLSGGPLGESPLSPLKRP